MWPLLIGLGAYLIAQGIQDGIDENRDKRLPPPPRHPQIPNNVYDELPYDCEVWPEDEYNEY